MSMNDILDAVRRFDGVLELAPTPGSEYPEVAWGDHFLYFAPDGEVPQRVQPYATIITKDYPDDTLSRLSETGRWRVNIHVGRHRFADLLGEEPTAPGAGTGWDFAAADTLLPHPLYRTQGWVAIVAPGPNTMGLALDLLAAAHADAARRWHRR
ncbi:DUF6194 family protein [Brevibacterium casei]|uniref:DUF6194 domain-containing protein n=2 Tax=Brevibacterium casei TaxID=33889 RepID=A0A2H1J225_9MICO|nr:DUF6194 family protein [Brevibacterium casei]SMX81496.1 hypothetical protein BC102111_01853 [Brevibacterium casei CIP 102111]